ncbi:amidohydrolase [Rhizobium sp. NLR9b]|uniref:amidohydrolase family protein n=1 Tax=unclassified Rhizobium TaxID=2613769 RepID=UPI001C83042A|nr:MULTISPECIES: amidohydrolase family protein [unclassified Rhizobium]MBX5226238.1 amidohydrolase [Rhizobium sp. NLR9b]MBX5286911.1 amidohydrolase [Rhizobium sp. NLR10b]
MGGAEKGVPGTFMSGCTCRGIDVHCHVVPAHFPARANRLTVRGWPSMMAADACHATVVINDKPYRTVSDACWVAKRRLGDMDRTGIRVQALSPMPELFGYWIETNAACDLVRYVNDTIAAIVAEGEGRFVGLGGLPLQDVDLANLELHRIAGELGFRGVEIGSNINGVPIGDSRFQPFFAEAEKLNAAVFVHAVRPTGMERLLGPAPLQQVLGYPTDVGLAAASVITGGLLQKFPKLRIAFSHGGGTFASLLPRLEKGYSAFPALNEIMMESAAVQARRLYVDSLVFDADILRHLVAVFGEERVLLGTDYPFDFQEKEPVARIEEAFADASLRERLTFANARAFLGLDEV